MFKIFSKTIFTLSIYLISNSSFSQSPGLIISEFFANPLGTDSCKEYVELIATRNINFASTPYTVILSNNGAATSKGWVNGAALTYAFSITTGSVSKGDVVYVGGSCMAATGVKLRTINTKFVNGDGGIGAYNVNGVMGNGGSNADGIAVFNQLVSTIDSSTIPVDAIFYGTGIGTAVFSGGTKGMTLPNNDKYSGGVLSSSSYFAPDAVSDSLITASGEYNTTSNTWTTARTWISKKAVSYGSSLVKLTGTSAPLASKYTWKAPNSLGTFQGVNILNGGFSGLHYDRKNQIFYIVTDRGPNLDAENNRHAIKIGGIGNGAKLFAVPTFNPQIIGFKAEGDSLRRINTTTLKKPTGVATSGLTNPKNAGGTNEIALIDTAGNLATNDIWGIDSEGLIEGNDSDYWFCEEYGVSVWHTDKNGKVINRYAPFTAGGNGQTQDIAIDSIFKYRNPNKGFEGIAFTPNNKVYAFIQNPVLFPANDVNLKKNSQLHRFIEIDPKTNTTKMFGYEHDKVPSSGALSSIKNDKRYIGDAVAVNDKQLLVLEHGKSATESYGKVYLVDISSASELSKTSMAYAGGTKSFEQLLDSTTASANGVTCIKKTLLIDLIALGYDPTIEKKEGLTIVNDSTIAIANDNDFGIVSNTTNGVASSSSVKSFISMFKIPNNIKLKLCDNVQIFAKNQTICANDSVILTSTAASNLTNRWYKDNVLLSGKTNTSLSAKASGVYELRSTNANGCVAVSNTKTITVNTLPTQPIISQVKDSLIASVNATTYEWFLNGSKISNLTTRKIKISQSGIYSVIITDLNGCKAQSTNFNATQTGVNTIKNNKTISIYPNPFNQHINVKLENLNSIITHIRILNVIGVEIISSNKIVMKNNEAMIPTAQLQKGLYLIEVTTNNGTFTQKIINN
jgi:hypothetical protein